MIARAPGFRVILTMHIRPGMEEDFEREWKTVAAAVTGHPANVGHWLMRSTCEDHVYYIGSDWVDEHQFRQFEESPVHIAHRTKLHPFRWAGAIATMRVLDHMQGTAAGIE